MNLELEWFDQNTPPRQKGNNGFSVDVLIHCPKIDVHQVGFYQYETKKWVLLCNEQYIEEFDWRYFNLKIDNRDGKQHEEIRKKS